MNIIIHPEIEKLQKQLADLIFEYDELVNHICPNIESEYLIKFGLLEYELYRCDMELKKVKRKLQLMQIQFNNEEKLNMELINKKLKKEFDEYEKSLKKQMGELEDIMNNKNQHLSKEDAKKLKKIYRECILKLHPDLNKNLTDSEKRLFRQIVEVFKNGDLKTLEALSLLISDENIESSDEVLKLSESIEEMKGKITKIKEKYPYNKIGFLKDSKTINKYRNELKELIERYSHEKSRYEEKIARLI